MNLFPSFPLYPTGFNQEEAEKAWNVASEEGYNFRDELLHAFFHAYRHDGALIRRVRSVAEGNGHTDMIQDLSNLARRLG